MEETTKTCQLKKVQVFLDMKPTLCNEAVKVLEVGTLDTQVPSADAVDSLIVDHEAAIRVLQSRVRGED